MWMCDDLRLLPSPPENARQLDISRTSRWEGATDPGLVN